MSDARAVQVVVPEGITDPLRPSGGNTYDLRLCQALTADGWTVPVRTVAGDWPWAGEPGRRSLATVLAGVPDGALVLVDGLVASTVPEVVLPASRRLRVVVLLHMPVGVADDRARASERAVLADAAAVVTTSGWTRRWLLTAYDLEPARVHVAQPGVDAAAAVPGSARGGRLLCVGAVVPGKGHDLLVAALARLGDLAWRCVCVGPLDRDPRFVARLRTRARDAGLDGRLVLAGPLSRPDVDASYAAADLLVHPSRAETYGMVVTEALARGLPVVAADAGGVAEALGVTADGRLPGMLVPPGDAAALAAALRRWLTDEGARATLRAAARQRRCELTGWPETAGRVARVLAEVDG